jgi:hypothetical protein
VPSLHAYPEDGGPAAAPGKPILGSGGRAGGGPTGSNS